MEVYLKGTSNSQASVCTLYKLQNWDKRLNKPVSLFHFGAEIDRDISIK